MSKPLPQSFYNRSSDLVAHDLLGKIFVRQIGTGFIKGKVVETEAYLASGDEASHNFKGKNERNQSLYKDAGHAYVHSMRQYFLLDLVTEDVDTPSSVLIRAIEPTEGIEHMKEFRGTDIVKNLANGPSKFCIAFGIDKEFDGVDVTNSKSPFYVTEPEILDIHIDIEISGRIGISRAKDAPLRFWVKGNQFISKKGLVS